MTDGNKTLIVALIDRTGSMHTIKTDTEGAFNNLIAEQRDLDAGVCLVSTYQFDHDEGQTKLETICEDTLIGSVPPLVIEPRGWTPLNDALGLTITKVGERLKNLPEDQRPGKVIFVVATDGRENYSTEYTHTQVREMVTEQTTRWGWEFIFLGVGIDAFDVGESYGFLKTNTVSAPRTGQGVRQGVATASAMVTRSRTK